MRELASMHLDGELAELEAARLDLHLGRCAACRAFVETGRSLTSTLRSAEAETLSFPIALPSARWGYTRVLQAGAAAVAVAAVAFFGASSSLLTGRTSTGAGQTAAAVTKSTSGPAVRATGGRKVARDASGTRVAI